MDADVGESNGAPPARRAGMFDDAAADPRYAGPVPVDETAALMVFLRGQRATLEAKCAGLGPAELARRAAEPSTVSLLGLVRHLADVERRWFRCVIEGADVPPLFSTPDEPDADFDGAVPDAAVVEQARTRWRAEVAAADRVVAAHALDDTGEDPWRGVVTLRWVLLHMIEEYARHNGHADVLRERIDGRTGV